MTDKPTKIEITGGMASETIYYRLFSLFLIMMTFFLIMTSQREFVDERVDQGISSVGRAFSINLFGDHGPVKGAEKSTPDSSGIAPATEGIKALAALLKSDVGVTGDDRLKVARGFLSLELPLSDFQKLASEFQQGEVLGNVSATLNRVLQGGDKEAPQLQMEIWLSKEAAQTGSTQNLGDQFVSNLIAKGVPAARLSMGVSDQVRAGNILLLFRPYYPYGVR